MIGPADGIRASTSADTGGHAQPEVEQQAWVWWAGWSGWTEPACRWQCIAALSDTAEEREVSTVRVSGAVGTEFAGDTNAIVTITEMAASVRSRRRAR